MVRGQKQTNLEELVRFVQNEKAGNGQKQGYPMAFFLVPPWGSHLFSKQDVSQLLNELLSNLLHIFYPPSLIKIVIA